MGKPRGGGLPSGSQLPGPAWPPGPPLARVRDREAARGRQGVASGRAVPAGRFPPLGRHGLPVAVDRPFDTVELAPEREAPPKVATTIADAALATTDLPPTPERVDRRAGRPPGREGAALMLATFLHGPKDIRVEEVAEPKLGAPTDAILRIVRTCICGSDLWPYRGFDRYERPVAIGHEYIGVVEEVGSEVRQVRPGQFVIGSFFASDYSCPICRAGYPSSCLRREPVLGAQAQLLRVPLADGTLVAVADEPPPDLFPSLLAASDVFGTGWFAALAAQAGPGKTVAVVGDGAVGLLGILSARQLGAERIIAMSRHQPRQRLAREFGATEVVEERGEQGVARIKELTDGIGADSTIEAVGTQEAMVQAIAATRPGGHVGFVGVTHGVELPGTLLFRSQVHLHGGPAPVRAYLPQLIELILERRVEPGRVFDLELPLAEAPAGYAAMDERRAIKVLLRP